MDWTAEDDTDDAADAEKLRGIFGTSTATTTAPSPTIDQTPTMPTSSVENVAPEPAHTSTDPELTENHPPVAANVEAVHNLSSTANASSNKTNTHVPLPGGGGMQAGPGQRSRHNRKQGSQSKTGNQDNTANKEVKSVDDDGFMEVKRSAPVRGRGRGGQTGGGRGMTPGMNRGRGGGELR